MPPVEKRQVNVYASIYADGFVNLPVLVEQILGSKAAYKRWPPLKKLKRDPRLEKAISTRPKDRWSSDLQPLWLAAHSEVRQILQEYLPPDKDSSEYTADHLQNVYLNHHARATTQKHNRALAKFRQGLNLTNLESAAQKGEFEGMPLQVPTEVITAVTTIKNWVRSLTAP